MSEGILDLSEESLIAAARQSTGLTDFGDEGFRDGLRVLVETYQSVGLRPGGRKLTRGRLIQLLCNRLRVEQAFRRHPEILEREIRSPVYMTGLPPGAPRCSTCSRSTRPPGRCCYGKR